MIALVIVVALLLGALAYREHQHHAHLLEREKAWDLERTNLINRIHRPDAMPISRPTEAVDIADIREIEDDEIDLVGTVQVNGNDID